MHNDSLKSNIKNSNNTISWNKMNQVNRCSQTLNIQTKIDNPIGLIKHQKNIKVRSFLRENKNYHYMPKFYISEYKRYMLLFVLWLLINIIVVSFSLWACITIANNVNINNWTMLILLPGVMVGLSFLIIYANNFIGFRNEVRNIDFSHEKVITHHIKKLYLRLKTGYINVNWFCLLSYILSGLSILVVYLVAWGMTFKWDGGPKWGILNDTRFAYNPIFLVIAIAIIIWIFCTLIIHIFLLISCHTRANKIDQFYLMPIVSTEEISILKKKKNHRDAIIFIAIIAIIVLFGLYIYKFVKSRRTKSINVYTK